MIIGIDTGGTFTDLIFRHKSGWGVHKLLSTPDNPARAVITGLAALPGATARTRSYTAPPLPPTPCWSARKPQPP